MPPIRKCSECSKPLLNEDGSKMSALAKTCCRAHQSTRARRLKKAKVAAAEAKRTPDAYAELVHGKTVVDVGREVLREQIAPLIQDMIVEEGVMEVYRDLLSLTPIAVAALAEDLKSRDDRVRQPAYTLVLKYTAGNANIAPRREEDKPQPMQVHFHTPTAPEQAVDATVEEGVECLDCGEFKPADQMVAGSERCQACFDTLQAEAKARYGD